MTVHGPDMDRILAMPRVRYDEMPINYVPSPLLLSWKDKLRPVQFVALARIEAGGSIDAGVFGDIDVGEGKFLIGMLAPRIANRRNAVMLTFSSAIAQAHREIAKFSPRFPEAAGYIPRRVAYEDLSSTAQIALLDGLNPGMVICDEAHSLCSLRSARTTRLIRYVVRHPDTRVVLLSGTFQRKKLDQLAHLAELALRDGTFLPRDDDTLQTWQMVLDRGSKPSLEQIMVLKPLMDWAGVASPEDAFRERFRTTPGVLSVPSSGPGCSLTLRRVVPSTTPTIRAAMNRLTDTWETPDGAQIVDAIHYFRALSTLELGFYYRMIYPEGEMTQTWLDARKAWSKAIRSVILYRQLPGMDSPARVVLAVEAGHAPKDVTAAWRAWSAVADLIVPTREVVWVDPTPVLQAVDYWRRLGRGVLWYSHSGAIEPILRELGVISYGAGSDTAADDVAMPACSVRVHGTGKNMQAWADQVMLGASANATIWQQLLGRTHREGQLADNVTARVWCASWFSRACLVQARDEAAEIERKYGKKQRLSYAMWEDDEKVAAPLGAMPAS